MDLNAAQRRLLMLLKMKGSQTAASLARELGMTNEGVRLHLQRLLELDLVHSTTGSGKVGRPKAMYHLAAKGHRTFPDTHSDLVLQLVASVREVLGEEAMERLIYARERQTIEHYSRELEARQGLESKLEKLVQLRSMEGYMADWQREEDHYLFIENHCPICAAATACQGFCRAELNTFQHLLGADVQIERVEHIVKGGRRCTYRIRREGD